MASNSPMPVDLLSRAASRLGPGRRRLAPALFCLLMMAFAAQGAEGTQALPATVEAALARERIGRDAVVVQVVEVGATEPRLSHRAQAPVNPASLMKLVTTYAALDLLGPAFTWTTPVYADGPVRDGVLEGNLYLKGQGDPKLVLERLWLLLRRVQQLGIQEVRGDIVLDRSVFMVPEVDPGEFDGEPLRPYNVQPDALLINFKSMMLSFVPDVSRGVARVAMDPPLAHVSVDAVVPLDLKAVCGDWRGALAANLNDPFQVRFAGSFPSSCGEKLWPIAYADARSYNARAVEGLWQQLGGRLAGSVREGLAPTGLAPLAVSASPALAELVRDVNKFSNNTMAQQLFLTLGLARRGIGTPAAARDVIREWLGERLGSVASAVVLDNGSGLSRETRVTAQFLERLLQSAWASPVMPELMSSLPLTGQDGTLRRAKVAHGVAHLKTGTLRDSSGIAGFVLGESGRRYVLVAIVNHPNADAARPALEALIDWVARDAATLGVRSRAR